MSIVDARTPYLLTDEPYRVVGTHVASDDSLAVNSDEFETDREEWNVSVIAKLNGWAGNPELLRDEGVIEPSLASICIAIDLATRLRDQEEPPPHRIVPNGDGGIVFERWSNSTSVTIEFFDDGEVELATFADSKMTSRKRII